MSDLRTAAQQALEALEAMQSYAAAERKGLRICDEAIPALRAALAQQAEPLNLSDPAIQKRLASQWGYVPAAAQAEPVQEPVYKVKVTSRWHDTEPLAPAFSLPDGEHLLYTAPPQREPLTEKEMYIVEEEARKNFRLAQAGPRGQMITYWDSLTPWLIRAVERAHGIKE